MFKKTLALTLAATMLVAPTISANATGWGSDDKGYFYYTDNSGNYAVNSWQEIGGKWFYFDENGYAVSGWQTIGGSQYYFNSNYEMVTGWQPADGEFYYFDSNGVYHPEAADVKDTIKGIDVSQYQGDMDWEKVKEEGIEFGIIRLGHGDHNVDPYFKSNMEKAEAAGVPVGVYFYSTAKTVSESISDAQFVIDSLQGYPITYPVAIDMEDSSQTYLGKAKLTEMTQAFVEEIKNAGYTPMVYCNENWAKNYIDLSLIPDAVKWIARYSGTYDTSISRDIWQAGSTTVLSGITVNTVDIDFSYVDYSTNEPVTKKLDTYVPRTGAWESDSTGYWYGRVSGGYYANEWLEDEDGNYYFFGSNGYMVTGWVSRPSGWYYMNQDGSMATEWVNSSGKWSYMDKESGAMKTGWFLVDDTWYHTDSDGYCNVGWENISNKWYFFNTDCKMQTGWQQIDGSWYYFNEDGSMASNTTVNGYKLSASGAMY